MKVLRKLTILELVDSLRDQYGVQSDSQQLLSIDETESDNETSNLNEIHRKLDACENQSNLQLTADFIDENNSIDVEFDSEMLPDYDFYQQFCDQDEELNYDACNDNIDPKDVNCM